MKSYLCATACALLTVSPFLLPAQAQDLKPGTWQVLMVTPKGEFQEAEYVIRKIGNTTAATMKWGSREVQVSGMRLERDVLTFSWDPYFPMECRFEREPDGQFMGACMDTNTDIGPMLLSPPGVQVRFEDVDIDKAFDVWDVSKEEYAAARESHPRTRRISYDELEPVPATRVMVNDRAANVATVGEGDVTVVLESGIGDDHTVWQRVQAELSKRTRVVSYDRPGLGLSESVESPRTPRRLADELRALLKATGHGPPYVLVGHEAAAFTLRAFMEAYPDDVVGAVFINPSHEREDEIWSTLDEESWTTYIERKRSFLAAVSPTAAREFEAYLDALESWDTRTVDVAQKVPSVILSGRRPVDNPGWIGETPQSMSVRESLHRSLAGEMGAEFVPATKSGSYVHLEEVALVVDAIDGVLSSIEGHR